MTNAQWKALNDYAEDMGYMGAGDVLNALKANGTLSRDATYNDLADLANGKSYDAMIQALNDNL
jgi:hypothetical protein